jgi:hypothetical protein
MANGTLTFVSIQITSDSNCEHVMGKDRIMIEKLGMNLKYTSPIPRMDPKRKKQWIKALRSGKFPQGKGCLSRKSPRENGRFQATKHCCLGVLCVISKVVKNPEVDENSNVVIYDNRTDTLPESVMEWADVYHSNPVLFSIEYRGGQKGMVKSYTLASLNDDVELNFDQISDCIDYFL